MIIKFLTTDEWWDKYGKWHKFYAWYPVFFDGGFAWFSYVERKMISSWSDCYYVYRLKE